MFEKMPEGKVPRFAEATFHEERWEEEAAIRSKRGVLKKIFARNLTMDPHIRIQGETPRSSDLFKDAETAHDFMYAEAVRDNEAFDKTRQSEVVTIEGKEQRKILLDKLDAEYEKWQEGLKTVVEHVKDSVTNPEGSEYRPLLLILGGGLKGPYSAGQVLGLHYAKIPPKAFKQILGVSTGAAVGTFYEAGLEQTAVGTSIYYEECTTPDFISFKRPMKVMDVERLTLDWMAKGPKMLDQQAVQDCPAELYYGVTRTVKRGEEPKEEFINAKTATPGMLEAMRASASVPLVAGAVPAVNGISYNDGAFDPLAIEQVIKQFNPTDILILPNTPFDRLDTFELSKTERFIGELADGLGAAGSLISLAQLEKFMLIKEQMRKSMETIQKGTGVNIGFVWPPDTGLDALKQNPRDMKASVLESARGIIDAFGAEQPHEIKLYETPEFAKQ